MFENENMAGEGFEQTEVVTATNDVEERPTENVSNESEESNKKVKSFNQEQVNELVRNRIERERSSVYKRYGVCRPREGVYQGSRQQTRSGLLRCHPPARPAGEWCGASGQDLQGLEPYGGESAHARVRETLLGRGQERPSKAGRHA